MKTQEQFIRSWPLCQGLIAIIITLALASSSAWAGKPPKPPPEPPPEPQSGYRLVNLGTLVTAYSKAYRINNAGWVVGESNDSASYLHAFVLIPKDVDQDGAIDWFQEGDGGVNRLMIDLGTLGGPQSYAFGVNDQGQIVGASDLPGDEAGHAVLWQVHTGPDMETLQIEMIDLGVLRADDYTVAWSVNTHSQVVGYTLGGRGWLINPVDTDGDGALDWYADGGNGVNSLMIDLGEVAGGWPIDINDAGDIVGTTGDVTRTGHGFLIRPEDVDGDGTLDYLMSPLLPSGRDTRSFASAINANGLIAGRSGDSACLWQVDATGAISATVLGQIKGYDATGLDGLNDGGQAVGGAGSVLRVVPPPPKIKQAACLTENGSLVNLADRIIDWGPFVKGGFVWAVGINESGQIVGKASASDGSHVAFIAIPVP